MAEVGEEQRVIRARRLALLDEEREVLRECRVAIEAGDALDAADGVTGLSQPSATSRSTAGRWGSMP